MIKNRERYKEVLVFFRVLMLVILIGLGNLVAGYTLASLAQDKKRTDFVSIKK